jgi:L-ascorbate metabolism protein UlaG (beta-lactamase superfamily)
MFSARLIGFAARPVVLVLSVLLASGLLTSTAPALSQRAAAQGTVKLEWFGNEFYRLTSPEGFIVLTSPWLFNADGPVGLEEMARTDLILVPNSHPDDMGNPIEIAEVSGATVIAPGPLGRWLIDNGLDAGQFFRANIAGGLFSRNDVLIKVGPSAHDNTLADGRDGGPAASYFIMNNAPTIFFSGHATMVADLAIYASVYQPEIAILGLTEPAEFAQVARLMSVDNPKLRVVIPSHIRPNAPILDQARVELDRLGLGHLLFMPELRRVYEY